MTQKKQVLYSLQVLFLLFNCQTPEHESRSLRSYLKIVIFLEKQLILCIILSLTVVRRKNRCIHCVYLVAAIFAVVLKYSNLFLPFTFFLYCFHFALCYKLIVCPKTTAFMKSIGNLFTFIQRDKSLFLYFGKIHCL